MTRSTAAVLDAMRQGQRASEAEISAFARGLADGSVSDAQAGAFAMAVCLHGLGEAGRVALTRAMRDTGDVLQWDLPGAVVDKHSTGGVGDAVSLLLAPMLAACGVYVPMISGRGLGHTGGTLDKLEAIPGLSVDLSEARFREVVAGCGCAIVSATSQLAPADKRLYAVRDVTGTVASNDLITASILSKKLAAGLEAMVLDVKLGSGAFMKTQAQAEALAQALVRTANRAGCPTVALITDMSQPLLPAIGNALEVIEIVQLLRSEKSGPLVEVAMALGAELLVLAGVERSEAAANIRLSHALQSGRAAEVFSRMTCAQGAQHDPCERPDLLGRAPVTVPVPAPQDGHVAAIDGEALGRVVVALGGGRVQQGDLINPGVGLSEVRPLGARVCAGDPLALLHVEDAETGAALVSTVQAAYRLGEAPVLPDLVHKRVS